MGSYRIHLNFFRQNTRESQCFELSFTFIHHFHLGSVITGHKSILLDGYACREQWVFITNKQTGLQYWINQKRLVVPVRLNNLAFLGSVIQLISISDITCLKCIFSVTPFRTHFWPQLKWACVFNMHLHFYFNLQSSDCWTQLCWYCRDNVLIQWFF